MSLPSPIVFTSWGFRRKGDRWQTGKELADWCTSCHIRGVAVQLGKDHDGYTNTLPDDIGPLRDKGLRVLLWGTAEPDYVLQELTRLGIPAEDWFPQIENDPERDRVFRAMDRGLRPSAIVTTYGGASTKNDIGRLRAGGVKEVHVECYSEAGPNYANLDTMMWQGTMYGWKYEELRPCMGTYRSEMPDDYLHLEYCADGYSLYLAEPMNGDQWVAWGKLPDHLPTPPEPTPPPEEAMDPITDKQALDTHLTASQAAIATYPQPKPLGRNTTIWRIASASDSQWNAAREQVKAALDKAGVPQAD